MNPVNADFYDRAQRQRERRIGRSTWVGINGIGLVGSVVSFVNSPYLLANYEF
jgi:hypothetical protein